VLNADARPLTAFPLSVAAWPATIHAVLNDRVQVVATYPDRVIRSARLALPAPSIVMLKRFVSSTREVAFTRRNLFLRDQYCCAYCGHQFEDRDLTFEHVIPRAQGGKTTWTNIVAACTACNGRKGNRTPEQARMPLQWRPWRPTAEELARVGYRLRPERIPDAWRDFMYWDQDIAA
jgi:5-methylcytosine-specific restriction endonuclease McrA